MPEGGDSQDGKESYPEILCNLTSAQHEAATYFGGPLLIIAGPGSGKTEVISCRAAYLIRSGQLKPENLLAATFTERAALTLKDRIQQKLPEINVEATQVSTIHSFCYRLLEDFRDESPFPHGFHILDEAGQQLFAYSRRSELGLSRLIKGRECDFFDAILRLYNLAAEELVEPSRFEDWCSKQAKCASADESRLWEERVCVARSYGRYLELLKDANLTDFGNLQRHALEMLHQKPAVLDHVRSQYAELLIDEYQDTNAVQEEIIFLVAAPEYRLTVVGDDDQSIYRFRGATVKNILNFDEKYREVKTITLEDNFRSVRPIIDRTSDLIRCNPKDARRNKYLKCRRLNITNDIAIIHEKTAGEEAEAIAAALAGLRRTSSISRFNDVAILLRSVRSYSEPYLEALEKANIPFRIVGDGGFFAREDISELYGLFTFLSATKPWGDRFVRCGIMGLSGGAEKALAAWKRNLIEAGTDQLFKKMGPQGAADKVKIASLIDLKRRVQSKGHRSLLEVLYDLLSITGYYRHAQKAGNTEAIRNIGILTQIVADFDENGGTRNIYPFLSYLQLLRDGTLDSYRDEPKDAVSIMTVHQAKGLEFPVVVVGTVMDGRFPTRGRRPTYEIPFSLTKSGKPEVDDPHLVDERKLFYVASTRARDLLIIGTSDIVNKRGGGPSPFIRELLGDRVEEGEKRGKELSRLRPEIEAGKTGAPGPRVRLSFYELAYYYQCPMRYKYFVVDGMASPFASRLQFGSSVHRALELLHKDILRGKQVGEENAASYVTRAWIPRAGDRKNKDADAEDRKAQEAAIEQVSRYVRENRGRFGSVEAAELPFSFEMEGGLVSGRIDLVERMDDGRKNVIDFKTYSSKEVEREQAKLQMDLYALGVEKSGSFKVGRHTLYFLEDGATIPEDWGPENSRMIEARVRDVLSKIQAGDFAPRPAYCPSCAEFKAICPYYEARQERSARRAEGRPSSRRAKPKARTGGSGIKGRRAGGRKKS
jgi:DNA helicase-2/ATP-dependent DNA helicase PcrA